MQKRKSLINLFLFFLFASLIILFVFNLPFLKPVSSFSQSIFLPVNKAFHSLLSFGQNSKVEEVREQNLNLSKKLLDQSKIEADNKALRDQFETPYPKSTQLLEVRVIGSPTFIPGVSLPQFFILDRGENDGIKKGQAIIYKDNLVGIVSKTSKDVSEAILVTNPNFSTTAQTLSNGVLGIAKGQGGEDLILDNVVLSDELKKDDLVLTKGDVSLDGSGVLPNLIIGKIVSVNKNPSSLFQVAKLQTLINFNSLSTVYIIK